jgi:outer membrane receptor protein involved in Fe transport
MVALSNGHLSSRRRAWLASASCLGLLFCLTPMAAAADPAGPAAGDGATLGEVVVTASRREETVTKLPFNISAYGGQALEKANVSTMAELTQQVPNFVIEDAGARSTASAIPIIRGLNASQPVVSSARFFQSPVGFYLGNSPVTGSIPLFDVERVEVLRGPQGTLYGAGALSGAVRIVPVDPKLGAFGGFVTGSVAAVSHSSGVDNSEALAINIPIGDTAAFRFNIKREYDAGFIDQRDILRRQNGDFVAGAPILANPADVANSPGVYFNKKDVNYSVTTSGRAAFLWKPTDRFTLNLAYNYSWVNGNGGPIDNPTYEGGPSPLDPRRILAATGEYERSLPTLEPFSRRSELASIDASYDLGFATLATTLSYGQTNGKAETDATVALLGSPYGYYYTGSPADPRVVIPVTNPDSERTYSEEVRLVSKTGGAFDYIVGAFFQQQKRYIGLTVWDPGADVQSAAAHGGSTTPIIEGGTYIPLFPNGAAYKQPVFQHFKDYSAYGELTWHISDRWSVTGGGRVFHQTFEQQEFAHSTFFEFLLTPHNSSTTNDHILKLNTSYALDDRNQVYATFSQGFRRGGANAFVTEGPVLEPTQLLTYQPDKTNNYEVGFKGTLHGIYYSADAFYVDWDKPQIDLLTPYNLTAVVVNANHAASYGLEFEAAGPVPWVDGLSFAAGFAWSHARLTDDFHLPSGNGAGGVVADAINGFKGDRLPGSPDFSGSLNLNYKVSLSNAASVTYSLGVDYRSSTLNQLPQISSNTPSLAAPAYALTHGSVSYARGDWEAEIYGSNLLDQRTVLAEPVRTLTSRELVGNWGNNFVVARPREIGLRLTRRW